MSEVETRTEGIDAAGGRVLEFLQRWRWGPVLSSAGGDHLRYEDVAALVELWRTGETRTEWGVALNNWAGSVVRCNNAEAAELELPQLQDDFPDARIVSRTVTTASWEEVQ